MKGYWNHPEETGRALREGWLHTGDLAWMDEDGFFILWINEKDRFQEPGFRHQKN